MNSFKTFSNLSPVQNQDLAISTGNNQKEKNSDKIFKKNGIVENDNLSNISPLRTKTKESYFKTKETIVSEESNMPSQAQGNHDESKNRVLSELNQNEDSLIYNKDNKQKNYLKKDSIPTINVINSEERETIERINSGSQIKKRKGDMTPNSHYTENNTNIKKFENFDEINKSEILLRKNTKEDSKRPQLLFEEIAKSMKEKSPANQLNHVENEEIIMETGLIEELTSGRVSQREKRPEFKPPKGKSQDLIKEFGTLKIGKDSHFMERMCFDIFKRRTKQDRLIALMKNRNKKAPEKEVVGAFNRLILDANRRIEISKEKQKLCELEESGFESTKSGKKITSRQFKEFYDKRIALKEENRRNKLKDEIEKKMYQESKKEEEILKNSQSKKVKVNEIVNVVNRLTKVIKKSEFSDNMKNTNKSKIDLSIKQAKKHESVKKYNFTFDNDEQITKQSSEKKETLLSSHFSIENKETLDNYKIETDSSISNKHGINKNFKIYNKCNENKAFLKNRSMSNMKKANSQLSNKKKFSTIDEFILKTHEETLIEPKPISPQFDGNLKRFKIHDFKPIKNKVGINKNNKFVPEFRVESLLNNILNKRGEIKSKK